MLSEERIVGEVLHQIRQKWETSTPQWANSEEPLRFCGLEILRQENGDSATSLLARTRSSESW